MAANEEEDDDANATIDPRFLTMSFPPSVGLISGYSNGPAPALQAHELQTELNLQHDQDDTGPAATRQTMLVNVESTHY
ncbi:hypothetical protein MY8738_007082 [Beauveria namnaoensis]